MKYNKLSVLLWGLLFWAAPMAVHAQTDEGVVVEETDDLLEGEEEHRKMKDTYRLGRYVLGNGLAFMSTTDAYSLRLSGYVQTTFHTQAYADGDDYYSRFRMRRARLRLDGDALHGKIRYRLGLDMVKGSETDAAGAGSMLQDAWVAYHPWGNNKLSITMGQRSTSTDNRELQMNSMTLQLVERSKLTSAFGTIREVGIFAQGSYKVGKRAYLRPSIAITDGDGPLGTGQRYGGLKYGARVNYLPFGLFRLGGEFRQGDMAHELRPKLSIGVAYSYNDGVSDRRGGREGGALLYQDAQRRIDLPDMGKLSVDFLFKYRGFSLLGEYVQTKVYVPSSIAYRVRNDGSVSSDFTINGVNSVENYIKNRMMVGSGFNVQGGYFFRNFWSVDARYTRLLPEEYSFMHNDLYNNRTDFYDLSVSKYLSKSYAAKVQANIGMAKTAGPVRKPDGETASGWEKSFTLLLQLAF